MQSWFRSGGGFRYSESAPVADDYDGNGVDVIAKFLENRSGYCVHFSSAMAVMARTLGIPSRIAVGYAPGTRIGLKGDRVEFEATSDDLHAWTEIYFQGVGWTRFDPTTSIGDATRFQEPASAAAGDTPDSESATPNQRDRRPTSQLDSGAPTTVVETDTSSRTLLATLAGLLVLAVAPGLVRVLRRRWRMRRGRHEVGALWRELEDVARDFGVPTSAADTPRGFAGRLLDRPGIDAESLEALLQRVEIARFSRDATQDGDGVDDLVAVLDSVRAGSTRRQRLVATLLPRSLAGRPTVLRAKLLPHEVPAAR
ncbi:DUF4129 domain-containing transglutaminase family protein [Aeromicrobium sp. UC242_57]|uniref:DUF4129 domain-containing transglutaminase family protein n=1 Tax=Aeromicrobium sp. UC242_57 TaxID=3374624 RepID=UPI0037B52F37